MGVWTKHSESSLVRFIPEICVFFACHAARSTLGI